MGNPSKNKICIIFRWVLPIANRQRPVGALFFDKIEILWRSIFAKSKIAPLSISPNFMLTKACFSSHLLPNVLIFYNFTFPECVKTF